MKLKNLIPLGVVVIIFFILYYNVKNAPVIGNFAKEDTFTEVDSIFYQFPENHIHGLAYDSKNQKLYIATHYGLFVLKNDKDLYRVGSSLDDYMGFSMHPTQPHILYASGHAQIGGNMGVIKSKDSGQTWRSVFKGLRGEVVDFHSMVISPVDPKILIGYFAGNVYLTEDGEKTWRLSSGRLPTGPCWNAPCLAADTKRRTKVYAGTYQGIYATDDLGESWSLISPGFFGGVIAHPKDNNVLYAFSMQGVIKSEDRGHAWNFKNTGLTLSKNEFIFGFSFDTNDPNTIYASTDQKIFKTENAGESWRRIM